MGRLVEEYGKVTAAYLKPIERGEAKGGQADEASEMVKTLGRVAERWVSDPRKIMEAQASITGDFLSLWSETLKRVSGEVAKPVAEPDKRDARFSDPDWSAHPVFDFVKQAYLIGSRWAEDMVERTEDLDPTLARRRASTSSRSPARSRRRISSRPIPNCCARPCSRTARISCAA
jgi:polyhydroxyalkanoate synthase